MVIYFLCNVLQCAVSILLCCFLCCFVAMSLVLRFAKDIRISCQSWLRSNQPLRPMSLGHWKAAFWLRSSGLATIISWILFEAPWQSWWMYSLGLGMFGSFSIFTVCVCGFILVLLGRFGDNYWYVWYLLMLLMQRWQMLRGNWTCSFPMVSLCQRLWASLNLTILIYLNHVDHTGP